jgi:hypothetical protein
MKIMLFIINISLMILYCSSNKFIPTFYSRDGVSFKDLPSLYENIPAYQDSVIENFIVKLMEPNKYAMQSVLSEGPFYYQVLIDENSKVEAIYVVKSGGQIVDRYHIEALKKSYFERYKHGKYSLLIPFKYVWIPDSKVNYR